MFVYTPENHVPQKRDYFNRKYIFQPSFFRGYVSFQGGKSLAGRGVVRYRPSLPPALDGITLRFAPGDTVAIVGRDLVKVQTFVTGYD